MTYGTLSRITPGSTLARSHDLMHHAIDQSISNDKSIGAYSLLAHTKESSLLSRGPLSGGPRVPRSLLRPLLPWPFSVVIRQEAVHDAFDQDTSNDKAVVRVLGFRN